VKLAKNHFFGQIEQRRQVFATANCDELSCQV
jgi:hypothetical protein